MRNNQQTNPTKEYKCKKCRKSCNNFVSKKTLFYKYLTLTIVFSTIALIFLIGCIIWLLSLITNQIDFLVGQLSVPMFFSLALIFTTINFKELQVIRSKNTLAIFCKECGKTSVVSKQKTYKYKQN